MWLEKPGKAAFVLKEVLFWKQRATKETQRNIGNSQFLKNPVFKKTKFTPQTHSHLYSCIPITVWYKDSIRDSVSTCWVLGSAGAFLVPGWGPRMPDALRWDNSPAWGRAAHSPQTFTCRPSSPVGSQNPLFGTIWTHIEFSRNITAYVNQRAFVLCFIQISPTSHYCFRKIMAVKSMPPRSAGSPGQCTLTSPYLKLSQ